MCHLNYISRQETWKGHIDRSFRLNSCYWTWKLCKGSHGRAEGNQKTLCYEGYQKGTSYRRRGMNFKYNLIY